MFGARVKLFTLLGFEVRVDASWLIIAVLITWSLASAAFPSYFPGLSETTYWEMAVVGTLGLFGSVILHELSHSLVARRFGMPMKGITLFIFGGVAEMGDEPPSPRAELLMAVAGPAMSVGIGVFALGTVAWGRAFFPVEAVAILTYLGWINLVLAGFNLIPAFPLDGGRVLRAILWSAKGDVRWATRIAAALGSGFGFLLVFLGVYYVLRGAFVSGIWWLLIGLFVRNASQGSYQNVLVRRTLEGEPVRRFMRVDPVTVPATASVESAVEDYVYTHHFKMLPVVENGGRLLGCVTTRRISEMERSEWSKHSVGELVVPCSDENSVTPDADAASVLALMNRTGNSRLMVVEGGRLAGVVTLKDLMRFISLKLELEGGSKAHRGTRGFPFGHPSPK